MDLLSVLPFAGSYCRFLRYREQLQVASISRAMDKYVDRCSVVRDACGDEGVFAPNTFRNNIVLKRLFRVARCTQGIPWTLQCADEVDETVRVGLSALHGISHGDGSVWRVSFVASQEQAASLREAIQQLRAVPHFHGGDEWSVDVESKVVGLSLPLDIVLQIRDYVHPHDGIRSLRIALFAEMLDDAILQDEIRIFNPNNCCRFFPVGFGLDVNTPPGLEAPLNDEPDDWFISEIDAHASDAKWNFSPAMEALFDALIRRSEIQCFFYDNVT
jgi:hypothetical protein